MGGVVPVYVKDIRIEKPVDCKVHVYPEPTPTPNGNDIVIEPLPKGSTVMYYQKGFGGSCIRATIVRVDENTNGAVDVKERGKWLYEIDTALGKKYCGANKLRAGRRRLLDRLSLYEHHYS